MYQDLEIIMPTKSKSQKVKETGLDFPTHLLQPGDRVIPGPTASQIIGADGSVTMQYHRDHVGMFDPADPSQLIRGQWTVTKEDLMKIQEAKKDQDGNKKKDFDDVQIARYKAGGMPAQKAVAKSKSDKLKESQCNKTAKGKPCPVHGLKECDGYAMEEGLKGGQKKLDKNHNNKLDKKDFEILRSKKDEPVKEEKWIKVHKSREGMFKGKGQAELQSMKAALKKRNAAKKEKGEAVPEKDKTKMAQLNFALRAKKGHGIHESQFEIQEMINDYLTLKNMQRVDEEDLRTLNLITEEIALTLENNLIPQPKTINESWTHDSLGKHLFENDVDQEEHGDTSGSMAKQQLFNAAQKAIALFKTIEDNDQLEPWVFYKINLATDYLDTVSEYLEYAAYEKNSQPGEMEVAQDDNYMESLAHRLYSKLRNI